MTPFRGFVREATQRNLDTRITVLYSVRTTNDIIFHQEFRDLQAQKVWRDVADWIGKGF